MSAVQIHWLIRRDMQAVLDIERASFLYPWSQDDFLGHLRQERIVGMVAEQDNKIVGYMLYENQPNQVQVLNFAVHPDCRYQGIGRAMLEHLTDKADWHPRRRRVIFPVSEHNLDMQLFLKACGLKAISVLPNFYSEPPQDAYLFLYRAENREAVSV